MHVRKATGQDRISAKLVAPAISPSLTSLFNSSLSQGLFPAAWKEASVISVPKSGDRDSANNYCPISVIPILAKVLESIVHDQVYDYLKILKEEQAGFRPNRSMQDILLRTTDDWKTAHVVVTVMTDLSKAFDTINQNLLMKGWMHMAFAELNSPGLVTTYLKEEDRVLLDREHSGLTKGVPQGSILGRTHAIPALCKKTCQMLLNPSIARFSSVQ